MPETPRKLVVLITNGPETELATVAFTLANGGITAGLDVSIFLSANGVNIARKRAADHAHHAPLDPLLELVEDFKKRGGYLWACTPCVKARGYEQEDLIDGVTIAGAAGMHEMILEGAASYTF